MADRLRSMRTRPFKYKVLFEMIVFADCLPCERAGRAAAIYYSLVESCKVNPLTYVLSHVRDKRVTLLTPDEFGANDLTQIG
jgi:hypothetical protein